MLVVTKARGRPTASTRWAQGGIAVADAPGDDVAAHLADTVLAGAGLTDEAAAAGILADGPAAVRRLIGRGARFDRLGDRLPRGREGGHHADRILHAGGDATGDEVERALARRLRCPAVLTGHLAVDVALDERARVAGVYLLDPDGRLALIRTSAVVLASGGAGQLFAASTNPDVATADGLAMALRAGAVAADLEFVQFHPTALWTPGAVRGRRPLVTEALRGAGAVLLDGAGDASWPASIRWPIWPLATWSRWPSPNGWRPAPCRSTIMCSSMPPRFHDVAQRFPSVTASCWAIGVDPAREPIPVSPAAHYQCGGVWTDRDGATTVPGLYAAGEVARTGLHGANRLASNSLLEGLVMGRRVALAAARTVGEPDAPQPLSTRWIDPAGRAAVAGRDEPTRRNRSRRRRAGSRDPARGHGAGDSAPARSGRGRGDEPGPGQRGAACRRRPPDATPWAVTSAPTSSEPVPAWPVSQSVRWVDGPQAHRPAAGTDSGTGPMTTLTRSAVGAARFGHHRGGAGPGVRRGPARRTRPHHARLRSRRCGRHRRRGRPRARCARRDPGGDGGLAAAVRRRARDPARAARTGHRCGPAPWC